MTPSDYLQRIDELLAASEFAAIAALVQEYDRTIAPQLTDDEFAAYSDLMELVDQVVDPVGPSPLVLRIPPADEAQGRFGHIRVAFADGAPPTR